jgi:transposase
MLIRLFHLKLYSNEDLWQTLAVIRHLYCVRLRLLRQRIRKQGQWVSGQGQGASGCRKGIWQGPLGLGAKLNTEAVIVIDKDNVSIMQISGATGTSQLMDKIPQILSGMNQNKQQGQQQGQQGQQQNQCQTQ